jgi:rubrerythrin
VRVKTQDALNLLIALEERAARIYLDFYRRFRGDQDVARCWWDMARDEYGHAGLLKMVRDLVPAGSESGGIGTRLWALVELVEQCGREAEMADSLARALELAIRLESSELDVLGHRVVQSVRSEVPEGAERSFAASNALCQRLTVAAGKVSDLRLRHRLEAMLAGAKGR